MTGYRISLIRHGITEANEKGIYIGNTDYSLSDSGIAELKEKIDKYSYPKVHRVYSSPLKRCTETANILFPYRETVIIDDLKEMNFGDFEGKSVDELIKRDDYKKWLKGGADNPAPGGESLSELSFRTFRALNKIIIDMMNDNITHTAIVTHAGIIANLLAGFGIPKIPAKELNSEPGEGYDIIITAQMWQRSQAFEILGQTPYYREDIDE